MLKLSPSSLNLFLECPRCFWLYVNNEIKRPSTPVATITTGLDKVVKEYFNLYRTKGSLPPFLAGKVPGKLIHSLPHRGWLEFNDHTVEARLGGYLDECLDLGGNFYAALDHKTRGSKPTEIHRAYQFQMDAYTFLLEQNNFPTKKTAYLIYYIPLAFTAEKIVEFEALALEVKTDPENARKVFYQAVSVLGQPIPAAASGCEFCKWTATQHIK
jgi:CRISPR/Cas system-associated exonuclease Cas4 (RecB family)